MKRTKRTKHAKRTMRISRAKRFCTLLCASAAAASLFFSPCRANGGDYIKWVDFNIPSEALCYTAKADINSHNTECPVSWISLLAMLAVDNGGSFKDYSSEKVDALIENYSDNLTKYAEKKLYNYYFEAYSAVLGGFLGNGVRTVTDENNNTAAEEFYGITAVSPVAAGYYYNHYDDFGAARSYGYKRSERRLSRLRADTSNVSAGTGTAVGVSGFAPLIRKGTIITRICGETILTGIFTRGRL